MTREALRKSLDVVEGACVERRRGGVGDGLYVVRVFRTIGAREQVTPGMLSSFCGGQLLRFRRANVSRLIRARRSRIAPCRAVYTSAGVTL